MKKERHSVKPVIVARERERERWKYYSALALIIVISFIAYLPVFHNGFLEWDDTAYIGKNPLIFSINLKDIFSQNVMGNWHPFTILTLALEYHLFGLNAAGYHSVNLLLHLLNVILVFYTVFLLSDKIAVALIAALLFGVHPLHVESVAWAAELKDLLYAFFFLASYIFYLKYLKDLNKKYYLFALLLFLVSLLSKAMAASLPLVLILTDYFKGRKINTAILIEKAPFLLLSIIIGVVAVFAQISSGASQLAPIFTFSWRIIFASYGFMSYLIKLLFPLNLRAFYPYPMGNIGIYIPAAFYIYLLSFLGLAIYIISSLRFTKKIIFGLGFFTLTICLVLQFLPVGKAIMADRYAYIPSIGIFYLAGEGLVWLWNKNQKLPVIILLIVSTVFFSVKTYAMCGIWKNDITLWTDVIRQDNTIEDAYFNRAISFAKENRNDEAIKDFTRALELKTDYAQAYNYRSMVYITKKRNDEAITDLNKAIGINPGYAEAYNNRGYIFMNEGRNDDAIKDFNKAIELKPDYAKTYNNRGNLFVAAKRNEEAIKDFNKAIELDANYSEAYNSRGISFVNDKRFNEAENDFNKAIKIKADNAEAYFNRGTLYFIERKNNEAIRDFTKAIELNQNYAEAYTNLGNIFFAEKRYEEAINQYSKAITLKTEYAQAYYNRGLAEFYFGKKESACSDLNKAADLGYKPATAALIHFCK